MNQVGLKTATDIQIVFNEVMGKNDSTLADPAGEIDDWIELANLSDQVIDLSGMCLGDKSDPPASGSLPEGTTIDANGYLIISVGEDSDKEGLHAEFKLSSGGESLTPVGSDAKGNDCSIPFRFDCL